MEIASSAQSRHAEGQDDVAGESAQAQAQRAGAALWTDGLNVRMNQPDLREHLPAGGPRKYQMQDRQGDLGQITKK